MLSEKSVCGDSNDSQYSEGDENQNPLLLGNPVISETKAAKVFPGNSRMSTHRETRYINKKENQKAGLIKYFEGKISGFDLAENVKAGMRTIVHSGWNTIGYETQKEIT